MITLSIKLILLGNEKESKIGEVDECIFAENSAYVFA
jgi:hypothetical protein